MAACASSYLAAAYLTVESARRGERELEGAFRRRGLSAAAAMALLAPLGLSAAHAVAPAVWSGLVGRGAPLVALSGASGVASAAALAARRSRLARALAALAVATLLGGWIAAQWPLLVVPDLSIAEAAAPDGALRATLLAVALCAPLLAGSLTLLYRTFSPVSRATETERGT
jgi:cytochrome d ubiquinol oxidase subunit II